MTIAFYIDHKKHEYHLFDIDSNQYSVLQEMPKFTATDLLIVYDQSFPSRAKIWDIVTVEKMIYFPGPKNLARLNLKYYHKYTRAAKLESHLKNTVRIYKKQL